MKKLMFIATAALCGAVMAEGEIVSANIVGYQTADQASDGKHPIVMEFKNVAGADIKLSDFKPNEYVTMYATKLMLLEPSDGSTLKFYGDDLGDLYPEGIPEGGLAATFVFVRESDGASADGWYLDDEAVGYNFDHPMNDYKIPFGFGYLCDCQEEGAGFVESGEVTQEDYEVPLSDAGKQVIGNAAVVEKTLADFVPNENVTMYATKLSLLEPSDGSTRKFYGDDLGDLYPEGIPEGGISATFVFVRESDGAPTDGWYLDDEAVGYNFDHPMNAFKVAPGQGFECFCNESGATIEIPGAL